MMNDVELALGRCLSLPEYTASLDENVTMPVGVGRGGPSASPTVAVQVDGANGSGPRLHMTWVAVRRWVGQSAITRRWASALTAPLGPTTRRMCVPSVRPAGVVTSMRWLEGV